MSDATWPKQLPVMQVRIARATDNLEKILHFYRDGLGLNVIGSFQNHDGYSGLMLGLPERHYHLEFTEQADHTRPAPDRDDLLVLYIPDKQAIGRLVVRLGALGYYPVAPANPFWEDQGVTIPDPDGFHVVLVESDGLSNPAA